MEGENDWREKMTKMKAHAWYFHVSVFVPTVSKNDENQKAAEMVKRKLFKC